MRRLGKQPESREATDGLIRRRLSEQHGSHAKPALEGTQKGGMTFPQDLYLTRDRDHRFQRGNPMFEQTESGLRAGAWGSGWKERLGSTVSRVDEDWAGRRSSCWGLVEEMRYRDHACS